MESKKTISSLTSKSKLAGSTQKADRENTAGRNTINHKRCLCWRSQHCCIEDSIIQPQRDVLLPVILPFPLLESHEYGILHFLSFAFSLIIQYHFFVWKLVLCYTVALCILWVWMRRGWIDNNNVYFMAHFCHIVLDIFFKPTTYKGDQFIFKFFLHLAL